MLVQIEVTCCSVFDRSQIQHTGTGVQCRVDVRNTNFKPIVVNLVEREEFSQFINQRSTLISRDKADTYLISAKARNCTGSLQTCVIGQSICFCKYRFLNAFKYMVEQQTAPCTGNANPLNVRSAAIVCAPCPPPKIVIFFSKPKNQCFEPFIEWVFQKIISLNFLIPPT